MINSGFPTRTPMVKSGTTCFPTELGHYNMWYAVKNEKCLITSDAVVETLSWFEPTNRDLTAIRIKTIYIDGCETVINKGKQTTVVWVDSKQIQKW